MTAPSLRTAWLALATCAIAISPATIHGEPDRADANKVADDLDLIEKNFAALIGAYGEAIAATFPGFDSDYSRGCTEAIRCGFDMMRGELLRVGGELERAKYEGADA
jgi:hypothetical protein